MASMDVWVTTRLSFSRCICELCCSLQKEMGYISTREFSRSSKIISRDWRQVTAISVIRSIWCALLLICIPRILNFPAHSIGNCFHSICVSGHLTAWIFPRYSDARHSFVDTTWASFKNRAYVSHFWCVPALLLTMPRQTPLAVTMGLAVLEDTLLASILAYYLHSKRTERW